MIPEIISFTCASGGEDTDGLTWDGLSVCQMKTQSILRLLGSAKLLENFTYGSLND